MDDRTIVEKFLIKTLEFLANYLFNILYSIDQTLNTFLGGRPDHTISGSVGYHYEKTGAWYWLVPKKIINAIFFWQKDHCKDAIEWDEVEKPLRKWKWD